MYLIFRRKNMLNILYEDIFQNIVLNHFNLHITSSNNKALVDAFEGVATPEFYRISEKKRPYTTQQKEAFEFANIINDSYYSSDSGKHYASEESYLKLLNTFYNFYIPNNDLDVNTFFLYETYDIDLMSQLVNYMMKKSVPRKLTENSKIILENIKKIIDHSNIFSIGKIGWSTSKYLIPLLKSSNMNWSSEQLVFEMSHLMSIEKISPEYKQKTDVESNDVLEEIIADFQPNYFINTKLDMNLSLQQIQENERNSFHLGNPYYILYKRENNVYTAVELHCGIWENVKKNIPKNSNYFFKKADSLINGYETVKHNSQQGISEDSKKYIITNSSLTCIYSANTVFSEIDLLKNKFSPILDDVYVILNKNYEKKFTLSSYLWKLN